MSFVPGDRHRFGLVLTFPLEDNLVLTQYDEAPYARGSFRNDAAIEAWAKRAIAEYDIRTPSADRRTSGRSRAATSRRPSWPASSAATSTPSILDQPTRGLDVGSIEFIHRQIVAKRDAGAAILLVSAELDEVLELSDRVAVMYRGEIVALVDGPIGRTRGDRPADGRRPAARPNRIAATEATA